MSDFSGRWSTTFGPMKLTQQGSSVTGTYQGPNGDCSLAGEVADGRLTFRYEEPTEQGEGWFELKRHGKFLGAWHPDGREGWGEWNGERGFDGVWETSFGLLRLVQEEDRVFGFYTGGGETCTVEGRLEGGRLTFRYQEPRARGEGYFELAGDGHSFQGEWRPDGFEAWSGWLGRRVRPVPGLIWLVVIEAHWQRHLTDKEYSFGHMLHEYLARLPNVQVRHRFFNNETGLRHWCSDLMYLAEPAVVMISTHGTTEGLAVHGQTISPETIVDSVRYADNIRLLHFSSCLIMHEEARRLVKGLRDLNRFPISGYTTSVDWGASAVIEFTYLDLILAKGLSPNAAAEQLVRLLPFAGHEGDPGAVYRAAGFTFLPPGSAI